MTLDDIAMGCDEMTHDELYSEVGKRIREAREKRGLTQADLASAIALTRSSITNIEQGRQRLLLHTLCEVAVALHEEPHNLVPNLDALLGRASPEGVPEEPVHQVSRPVSEQEWEWIRSSITPSDKRG